MTELFPYVLGRARRMTAREFLGGAAQVASILASTLPDGASEMAACRDAIPRTLDSIGESAVGHGCQLVPVFVCVARRR